MMQSPINQIKIVNDSFWTPDERWVVVGPLSLIHNVPACDDRVTVLHDPRTGRGAWDDLQACLQFATELVAHLV